MTLQEKFGHMVNTRIRRRRPTLGQRVAVGDTRIPLNIYAARVSSDPQERKQLIKLGELLIEHEPVTGMMRNLTGK